ncbi:beta-lactamase/transpeptidase-like protein [Periconia macrospinosa]|uniref:Beta-lactamase/transpeptidase-like protein n=1 Tax=Periconia macrospinosa TaxID=97972 RepID=A0A2V1DVK3_9PLEO|nr:beta-lactamase/transpeptidase-like protein [Periconia macrospinosa]
MTSLPDRLARLEPDIQRLMDIGGTPGVSLGVMTYGHLLYYKGFGKSDVEKGLPMTENTILPVGAMTKAVTAAAMGILVEEKKATWDTLVKDVIPDFDINDQTLKNDLTITDLLSQRSGMSWSDNLLLGTENNVLISHKNLMKHISRQTRLLPFRGQYSPNTLGYEVIGKVIEILSGQSFFDFVQNRIFNPLGMDRTFLRTPPSTIEDVGTTYNTLDDGTTVPITAVKMGDDWVGAPHGGMRSSVTDLMKLYSEFMVCYKNQLETGERSSPHSPLKQVPELMSTRVPIDQPSMRETSYGRGWARVQLPGRMGHLGINADLMVEGMPVVCRGAPSQLAVFHQGSFPGAMSVVILLPGMDVIIVVSTNALALNDVADWIGQLVLEEVVMTFDNLRTDFIELAEISKSENLKWYPELIDNLSREQNKRTSPRPLEQYAGTYWDQLRTFKIEVVLEDGQLYWLFQGLDSEKFALKHYENDCFTWLAPRNELLKRGRWVGWDQGLEFWQVSFQTGQNGKVDTLLWSHDNGVPALEYKKAWELRGGYYSY